MRILHYVEIENFKRLGGLQRIELDHPAVLIGPNNCGKTSVIQAIALWSQAVRTWLAAKEDTAARERKGAALNRLAITAVPVQRTRYFWHNTQVHSGRETIPMSVTAGLPWKGSVMPVRMRFRHQGDELVYCVPDEAVFADLDLLRSAAAIDVELLYPMSGLTTEEPVLKEGRINVLLGQGETAQVLRNLCLVVARSSPVEWNRITALMHRLFGVELGVPEETVRGAIELQYQQPGVRERLDIAMAGRGLQQLLLVFAYLLSHPRSVLLIDEPDAHLEILRQRQVYVLLRDIASGNGSQVVLVTHSEVILDEAIDRNLTLLIEGRAERVTERSEVRNALKHYGTEHYIKARERGYVLYVEGATDLDMLRALAERSGHRAASIWDERVNVYYVRDNFPEVGEASELERVEGGFGITPTKHFHGLRDLLPALRGVAILDNDRRSRVDAADGGLTTSYWKRYETENYFITPTLLANYAKDSYRDLELFDGHVSAIQDVLDDLVTEMVFGGSRDDYQTYRGAASEAARLIWESKTESLKLSAFAEAFFERLAARLSMPVLLRRGEFHRLVARVSPAEIPTEVSRKLDLVAEVFEIAANRDSIGPTRAGA